MKFSIVLALGLVAAAGLADAASFTPTGILNFSSKGSGLTATFSDNIAGNSAFSDYFVFTLPSLASGSGAGDVLSGIAVDSTNNLVPNLNFSNFQLGSIDSYGTIHTLSRGTLQSISPLSGAYLSFNDLLHGVTYALAVSGNSAVGGSYSGNISLSLPAVDEPGEFEMLLAGFGLISLFIRNRRNAAC